MRGKTVLKTFCVGLLLASVFGVAATGCSTTPASSTNSVETVKTYNVTVKAGEGVYASTDVKTVEEGGKVTLTVVLTGDDYDIKSVKVGGKELQGSVDTKNTHVYTYTYTAEKADVAFEVETYDVVAAKAHKIAYTDENGKSHADGLASRADKGEEVSFTIGTVSGYSVEGLEIYFMDGNEKVSVEFTGNSVTGYKFTMPDANVIVKATVLGAYFKANFDEETLASATSSYGSALDYKTSDFIHQMYIETGTDEEGNSIWEETKTYFARAGQKCLIVRKHQAQVRLSDFIIDGKKVTKDATAVATTFEGKDTYSFTMPNYNPSVKAEVVNAAEEAIIDISLDTTGAPNLDVEMFKITATTAKADDGKETTTYAKEAFDGKWKYGETIYVAASTKEGVEGYSPKTFVTSYTSYSYSFDSEAKEQTPSSYDWGSGYSYSDVHKADLSKIDATIASAYTDKVVMEWTPSKSYSYESVKISVIEKNENQYKNTAIVKAGTFTGGEFYSFSTSGTVTVQSKSYVGNTYSVAGDGSIKSGSTTKDLLPDGYDGSASLFEGQNGYKMFYDGGSAFAISYTQNYTLLRDLYVCSTKITGTNSEIKLIYKATSSTGAAGDAYLYGFYQDGVAVDYILLYVDASGTLKGTSKVTVEVTDGTDPFVKDAKVTVKDSETSAVLAKFNITDSDGSGSGDSGSNIPTNLVGTWINSNGSLAFVIADDGTCTYISDVSAMTMYNGTYTYDSATKEGTISTIHIWDGENYFTVSADGNTVTLHLEDEYQDDAFTLTLTKLAE